MLIYLARRLALAVVTCAAISVLTFVIIRLPPGDFVDAYIANLAVGGSSVSAEQAAAMRREYGLDRPVVVQYGLWMGRVISGDFGVSMMWKRPVTEVIGDRLWLTMAVSFAALLLTWMIALPIGIYSAARQYSDRRLHRDDARLHRPCDSEFPARADPDVSRLPLSGPERRRTVHARICAGAVELGKIRRPDGPPSAAGVPCWHWPARRS